MHSFFFIFSALSIVVAFLLVRFLGRFIFVQLAFLVCAEFYKNISNSSNSIKITFHVDYTTTKNTYVNYNDTFLFYSLVLVPGIIADVFIVLLVLLCLLHFLKWLLLWFDDCFTIVAAIAPYDIVTLCCCCYCAHWFNFVFVIASFFKLIVIYIHSTWNYMHLAFIWLYYHSTKIAFIVAAAWIV